MKTTDFTGTYDYEKAEADHAAARVLEDIEDGYHTIEQAPAEAARRLARWAGVLGGADSASFQDFKRHFIAALADAGIEVRS